MKKKTNKIQKHLKEYQTLVEALGKVWSKITSKLSKALNEKLTKICSLFKEMTEGMDSLMLQVVKHFGVKIEAYCGGSFNGKCVNQFIEKEKANFCEFARILKANRIARCWMVNSCGMVPSLVQEK